uniref:Septin-type G domain-containing protein n=1 Tax=Amphilophus citrinellus TaxID=61819 RepID=A0A3Q0RKB2_AMPCI
MEAHSKPLADAVRENSTHLESLTESLLNCTLVKEAQTKRLADDVKENSTLLESKLGALPIYKTPLKQKIISVTGCRSFSFGAESSKHNRTIMVLGATGAGKSTLINGMINYILGVEWKDKYRFKLVEEIQSASQAHSQTSEVTVYKIHHQEDFTIPFSLTIVDTPGFGDTRGIERDREIVEQLRRLFSAQLGVSEIDAVCFVAQAALARLTPTQKYVFDSVLSIFGKDVAENIRILVTFADGQRPPVLEAINASGVPCPKTKDGLPVHFKFNNSALFANNKSSDAVTMDDDGDDDEGGFDKMFWEMGTKSMKRFFAALNIIETKSLTLTKEVLRERKMLEISVENLQVQVKLGLAKMEEIKETSQKLKEHEAEISRNENFEFEVTVKKPVQEDISGTGCYITNCQQCNVTCHYPCGIPNDADKRGCVAMGKDEHCTRCSGKCIWRVHFNQKYRWIYKDFKEKRTINELKANYQRAKGEKITFQGLLDKLNADYDSLQAVVMKLMASSAKCLNRLKEIALKPNPLSTPEYIDMLIEGEKSEGKPGWNKRVLYLMSMKEKAEYMAKVEKGEDPLQQRKTDLQQQNTKTNNIWRTSLLGSLFFFSLSRTLTPPPISSQYRNR